MKTRKFIALALVSLMLLGLAAACSSPSDSADPGTDTNTPAENTDPNPPGNTPDDTDPAGTPPQGITAETYAEYGIDENLRFLETRNLTVEIYNRSNDGGTDPTNNYFTDYLKQAILDKHNIAVEYVSVPRWGEDTEIPNLLAAGTAPDVSVTYNYNAIQTYGNMGGVIDMYPYLTNLAEWFPNAYDLMGTQNLFYYRDPVDNHVWAVEAFLKDNWAVNTFIRKDWLDTLGIAEPTTLEEFEAALVAFKDNAATLLPETPDQIIPFGFTHDIRWQARPLLESFLPDDLTDKERYVTDYVQHWATTDAMKEAVLVFNKWFNMGLTWKDFMIYDDATLGETFDNLARAGYVGAFAGNVDMPYRNGENSYVNQMIRNVGPEAMFVSISPFPNDAGNIVRMASAPVDRKVFMPATNDEPLAGLLYIDFISSLEVRKFLQIGDEGVNHTVLENGAIEAIAATGEKIMNSPRNIDYTITINGLDLGDADVNNASLVLGYPGTPPEVVLKSITDMVSNSRVGKPINLGQIVSEADRLAGLEQTRNAMLVEAVQAATPEEAAAIFDEGVANIKSNGGDEIIQERTEKWEALYGADVVNLD
ncbi:MAG: extracellular solute-binding protein [Oscillospiraceae bacterium]|jgi:putative aldouronate transport system substrate-binding protein|nr:extracellular solute-binding protein [Oscillospiraceae bacterium]